MSYTGLNIEKAPDELVDILTQIIEIAETEQVDVSFSRVDQSMDPKLNTIFFYVQNIGESVLEELKKVQYNLGDNGVYELSIDGDRTKTQTLWTIRHIEKIVGIDIHVRSTKPGGSVMRYNDKDVFYRTRIESDSKDGNLHLYFSN